MTRRRVALVVGQLQMGGAERQLHELAVRLDRSRFEVFVVCLSDVSEPFGGMLRQRGVQVVTVPRAGHRDLTRAVSLARTLREQEATLAHSFLLAANAYTWAATRLGLSFGRALPYIASSRTCIPPRGWLAARLHRRAFLAARAIIANSSRVMEYTRDRYGLPGGRIRVIPNGVDLAAHASDPAARSAARAVARGSLGLPPGQLVVGTLGRLSREKNLPLFLEMASRLGARRPDVLFVLVGDGPELADLRERAAQPDLSGRVRLAAGRPDIAAVLPAFDLFVSSSDTEGMPNAVMEAMAAGLPVVATDVGGTSEVVVPDVTGHLVPRGDLDTLVTKVAGLLEDDSARRALGEGGRQRIARLYSVERMVESTQMLYEEVAG